MPKNSNEITYDEFLKKYNPIKNPVDNEASYDGFMLETYGEEARYVDEQRIDNPKCIWTILDNAIIVAGFHYVNRLGYLLTEVPFENEQLFIDERDENDKERES